MTSTITMIITSTTIHIIWQRSIKRDEKACVNGVSINALPFYLPLEFLIALFTRFVSDVSLVSVRCMSSSISSINLHTQYSHSNLSETLRDIFLDYLFCSSSSTPMSVPIWCNTVMVSPTRSNCLSCWAIRTCIYHNHNHTTLKYTAQSHISN